MSFAPTRLPNFGTGAGRRRRRAGDVTPPEWGGSAIAPVVAFAIDNAELGTGYDEPFQQCHESAARSAETSWHRCSGESGRQVAPNSFKNSATCALQVEGRRWPFVVDGDGRPGIEEWLRCSGRGQIGAWQVDAEVRGRRKSSWWSSFTSWLSSWSLTKTVTTIRRSGRHDGQKGRFSADLRQDLRMLYKFKKESSILTPPIRCGGAAFHVKRFVSAAASPPGTGPARSSEIL